MGPKRKVERKGTSSSKSSGNRTNNNSSTSTSTSTTDLPVSAGYLVSCDVPTKQYIQHLNDVKTQDKKFILEDLDSEHLLIKAKARAEVERAVERWMDEVSVKIQFYLDMNVHLKHDFKASSFSMVRLLTFNRMVSFRVYFIQFFFVFGRMFFLPLSAWGKI